MAGGFSAAWGNSGGLVQLDGTIGPIIQNTMISAVVGGAASVIGGGKFYNGAMTGAAGYLFNDLAHAWAGTQANNALGEYLNARDEGQWIVNQGSFWNMVLGGRPDFVYEPTGATFELKTNYCLSSNACEMAAQGQLNTYVNNSDGKLNVGDVSMVFKGAPFLVGYGVTMDVAMTFTYNPGPGSGLIGYNIIDSEFVLGKVWSNFYKRNSPDSTTAAPFFGIGGSGIFVP